MFQLTLSVLPFQMNLYNKVFISFFISLGMCSTFERKVNFEIPKVFTISTFPFRDSDLLFHNASCLSKSQSGGSKFALYTSSLLCPIYIPKIFIGLVDHFMLKGFSVLFYFSLYKVLLFLIY